MAKDEGPKTETPAPDVSAAVTFDQLAQIVQSQQAQLLAVVRELHSANTLTVDKVREIATQATIDAYDRTSGKNWDIAKFPARSALNPRGEKDHPRDQLVGEVHWVGFKLSEAELTPDEIALVNALEPGVYHDGQWVVKDLQPGMRDRAHRKLLVLFPCAQDQRGDLPSMLGMLREMTQQTASPVLA